MVLGLAPRPGTGVAAHRLIGWLGLHTLGLALGGAVVGFILGLIGQALSLVIDRTVILTAAGLAVIAYALSDFGVIRLPRAGRHWQVPRGWLGRFPSGITYPAFGLLLGAGFLTVVPFGAFTALLALEAAAANPWAGALIGASYGLGRGAGLLHGSARVRRESSSNPTLIVPSIIAQQRLWARVLALASMLVGIWILTGAIFEN